MKRHFNTKERLALRLGAGNRCQLCGVKLTADNFHADHRHPYSKGGETHVRNGQALCARCNLKKGAKADMAVASDYLWQTSGLNQFRKACDNGQRTFLVSACPGAGKTRFSVSAAVEMLKDEMIGRVVVVCNTRHQKHQWYKAAQRAGLPLRKTLSNEAIGDPDSLGEDVVGYVATYAQVANWPQVHAMVCASRSTLVVCDEIHHAGDGYAWGEGLNQAFEDASYRLLLTGTPFRHHGYIPWVEYDKDGKSAPDYSYNYGRAVADRVCAPLHFQKRTGDKIEWVANSETRTVSFKDRLSEDDANKRLNAAISPQSEFSGSALEEASNHLSWLRSSEHPRAAGLVIAKDIKAAGDIADKLQAIEAKRGVNEAPVVVHSDDKESSDKLRDFDNGSTRWLVAVDMVSEGVDIHRLRVGVYLSNKKAELYLRQFFGRFVRFDPSVSGDQRAEVFIPNDERISDVAKRIEQEADLASKVSNYRCPTEDCDCIRVVNGASADGVCQTCGYSYKEPSHGAGGVSDFIPLSADGYDGGTIYRGSEYEETEVDWAKRVLTAKPGLSISRSEMADIGRLLGYPPIQNDMFTNATSGESERGGQDEQEGPEERLKRLAAEVQRLSRKIVALQGVSPRHEGYQKAVKYAFADIKRDAGVSMKKNWEAVTIREREAMVDAAKRHIAAKQGEAA